LQRRWVDDVPDAVRFVELHAYVNTAGLRLGVSIGVVQADVKIRAGARNAAVYVEFRAIFQQVDVIDQPLKIGRCDGRVLVPLQQRDLLLAVRYLLSDDVTQVVGPRPFWRVLGSARRCPPDILAG
jgi:hypothetical protein